MIYTQVVDAVRAFLNRPETEPSLPTFIALAEAEINRRLDVREMVAYTVVSAPNGTASVPCDFAGVKAFRVNSSPRYKLEYLRPDAFDDLQPGDGAPYYYTIVGDTFLFSSGLTQAQLRYRKRLCPLSAADFSNFVSEHYPDLYLYGALKHAAQFLADERLPQWAGAFEQALEETNRDSLTQNAGSSMQMQVQGVV
jgi:hypothetical protein